VAWGARAIIKANVATFDLLPDRQHMVGSEALRKALGRALNALAGHDGYLAQAQENYDELRRKGEVGTRTEGVVKLVDDPYLCVHADPRASHGYLYVAAWFNAQDLDLSDVATWGDPRYEDEGDGALKWLHGEAPPAIGEQRTWLVGNKPMRGTIVGYRDTHGYLLALVVTDEPFCNPDRLPVVGLYGCDIIELRHAESEDNDGSSSED
jgi:hypothetical protein